MDARFWDEMYREKDKVWSGNPNGVLVAEVADLPPGRALDVGTGEGADAFWLAERGWRVSAWDISQVAIARATSRGDANGAIEWRAADVRDTAPPKAAFDLVILMYFTPDRRTPGALEALVDSVAPGGTLLVVFHHPDEFHEHEDHADHDEQGQRPGPDDFFLPGEIPAFLDGSWKIVTNEERTRVSPAPEGTRHTRDVVLRARRS